MPAHPLNDLDQHMDKWIWSSSLFWSKVQKGKKKDCWSWSGSTGPNGDLFGIYMLNGNKRQPRMMSARRVMYAEHTGTWLNPEEPIYHGCGNRRCLNPFHFTNKRPSNKVYENYREQHGE